MAITVMAPKAAWAQGDSYARVSGSMTQMYEGNLFATPAFRGPQAADLISRFGPALEAGYLSVPLQLGARYEIDAERYRSHPELTSSAARQDAAITLRYLPMPRLGLSVDGSYVRTQTPGEFNLDSQIAVGRARAERIAIESGATYYCSDVTKLSVISAFTNEALAGGIGSSTSRSSVAVERRMGPRDAYRVEGQFQRFGFGNRTNETSYALVGRWLHAMTERTGVEIGVGPRVREGALRPEVSVLLNRQLKRGEFSVQYTQTELTTIGVGGAVDLRRVSATLSYHPLRNLMLTGTPAFSRSTQEGVHIPVYTLDAEAVLDVTRKLSLSAFGRLGRQEGTLAGPGGVIPYRSLALRLMVTLPRTAPRNTPPPGAPPGAGRGDQAQRNQPHDSSDR